MDRAKTSIDATFWRPYGMEDSDSFAVDFGGVHLACDELLGGPNDYARSPWFTAGALAVRCGASRRASNRLTVDFGAFLRRRELHEDPIQLTRFGECVIVARSARMWVDACVDAWMRYDSTPGDLAESALLITVDSARTAVERAALDVAERVERGGRRSRPARDRAVRAALTRSADVSPSTGDR